MIPKENFSNFSKEKIEGDFLTNLDALLRFKPEILGEGFTFWLAPGRSLNLKAVADEDGQPKEMYFFESQISLGPLMSVKSKGEVNEGYLGEGRVVKVDLTGFDLWEAKSRAIVPTGKENLEKIASLLAECQQVVEEELEETKIPPKEKDEKLTELAALMVSLLPQSEIETELKENSKPTSKKTVKSVFQQIFGF